MVKGIKSKDNRSSHLTILHKVSSLINLLFSRGFWPSIETVESSLLFKMKLDAVKAVWGLVLLYINCSILNNNALIRVKNFLLFLSVIFFSFLDICGSGEAAFW